MSFTEIALIMFVALILFGPEDLPVIARALGKIVFQGRKLMLEITQEFQQVINTPADIINETLKDTPAPQKSKLESNEEDIEELLSYEDTKKDASSEKQVQDTTNPLTELPSEIVSSPKDTRVGD
ncbi:MAG: twin-arginine translocase TatA/TatE family subunit [Desulfitobacteriia bacterium]|jgi:Sec-independent protein translocase protein TatA